MNPLSNTGPVKQHEGEVNNNVPTKVNEETKFGSFKVITKDEQGVVTRIDTIYYVIESVGKEIQKAKNEDQMGKPQQFYRFEKLNDTSAPVFKSSDNAPGGYELAEEGIKHLKTQSNTRSEEIEEPLTFESRDDYVSDLAYDFKEYLKLKDKILDLEILIEDNDNPLEGKDLERAMNKLKDLNFKLSITRDSIRETRASFNENRENMNLGDWNKLISDALEGGHQKFTAADILEVYNRWKKK